MLMLIPFRLDVISSRKYYLNTSNVNVNLIINFFGEDNLKNLNTSNVNVNL